jgi:hypothetical protein
MIDVAATFEKYEDEFLKTKLLDHYASVTSRSDLRAFLLLDRLLPGTRDMISSAGHDEIWLDVGIDELAGVATDEDILYLVRCGVRLCDDGLCMFV